MGMKGFFFSIDALAASTIIVLGIVAISMDPVGNSMDLDINFLADDTIDVLSELKIHELESTYVDSLIANGNITNLNNSVLEQAQIFWAEGKVDLAQGLLNDTISPSLKGNYRFGLFADKNDVLLNDSAGVMGNLMSYKKFVSGIQEGKKTHQFMTKVSFTQIESKQTSVYHYFGGFVGQGNITANISLNDLDGSEVTELEIDLDTPSGFNLYVNNAPMGHFSAPSPSMRSDNHIINNSDLSKFQSGENLIRFNFDGKINESYIGGGYIKVTYETRNKSDENLRYKNGNVYKRIRLSGIDGAINMYDSFYIPGEVNSLNAVIDYIAEHDVTNSTNTSLFINFGNTTVYRSDNFSTGRKRVVLNYSNLTSHGINKSFLSRKTVPFRIGYSNINYTVTIPNVTGAGDAVLVTDRSGSMAWHLYDNNDGLWDDPSDPDHLNCTSTRLNDPDASRAYVARCVDKEFTRNMLDSGYNRVGLTSYETSLENTHPVTTNYISLRNQIHTYDAQGGTCTSCGVWAGIQELLNSNNNVQMSFVQPKAMWHYYRNYSDYSPQNDSNNRSWFQIDYDHTTWKNGTAILGLNTGNTFMYPSYINYSYLDIWDMASSSTLPVEFTSGLNSTGNSFGLDEPQNLLHEADKWNLTGAVNLTGTNPIIFEDDFDDATISSELIWHDQDVWGGTSSNEASGELSISARGQDVWTSDDEYAVHYINDVSGDVDITTKVNSQSGSEGWRKAGLMIKNDITTTTANSGYIALASTGSNGVVRQHDDDQNGYLDSTSGGECSGLPIWLKIEKRGSDFTTYCSNDGSSWNTIDTQTLPDADLTQDIGLFVTSHDNSETSTVDFESFTIKTPLIDKTPLLTFNSSMGDHASVSDNFTVPNQISQAHLLVEYTKNNSHFYGNATLICNLTNASGSSKQIYQNEILETSPEGTFRNMTDLLRPIDYLDSSNQNYTLSCYVDLSEGSGPVILLLENLEVNVMYSDGWDWSLYSDEPLLYGAEDPSQSRDMRSYADPSGLSGSSDGQRIKVEIGGMSGNSGDSYVDSGAFGVQFHINKTIYEKIKNGAALMVSFDYEAFDREATFASGDETEESCWIKARFGNHEQMHYLGYHLDNGLGNNQHPEDSSKEILYDRIDYGASIYWHEDDVWGDFNYDGDNDRNSGTYTEDVSNYVNSTGDYYLELGAKFDASGSGSHQGSREGIVAYFDNVQVNVSYLTNSPESLYFRKKFQLYPPLSYYSDFLLKLRADDNAQVFINGDEVYKNTTPQTAQYWNKELSISSSHFKSGKNTIAVKLINNATPKAEFDAELTANYTNPKRGKAILIMSDGEATYCSNPSMQGSGWFCNDCAGRPCCPDDDGNLDQPCTDYPSLNDEAEQALGMACWANQEHNISIYTVLIGQSASGIHAMNLTASLCDNESNFYTSQNYSGLSDIYELIAKSMIEKFQGNYSRQSLSIGDDFGKSELLPSSYLEFNYTVPSSAYPGHDDIFISANTLPFGNNITKGNFTFMGSSRNIIESSVSSYSGDHWTNNVTVNNGTHNFSVFTLGEYGKDFKRMGDPYRVGIPIKHIKHNTTTGFKIHTGLYHNQTGNGSMDNRFFYTFSIDSLGMNPSVSGSAKGCKWNVTYIDGTSEYIDIPMTYSGSKICHYHNATYDRNDSIDTAAYDLFSQLDIEGNRKLVVKLDPNFMQVRTSTVGNVPSLWGPSITETRVWK